MACMNISRSWPPSVFVVQVHDRLYGNQSSCHDHFMSVSRATAPILYLGAHLLIEVGINIDLLVFKCC